MSMDRSWQPVFLLDGAISLIQIPVTASLNRFGGNFPLEELLSSPRRRKNSR